MALTPNLGDIYEVSPNITDETLAHLRRHTNTEAVCFWLGATVGTSSAVIKTVWVPEFTATAVSYDINPMEMLRLKAYLDESSLSLVAQVHSHPGMAFHSTRDDLNAASPWPGFISIVVPNGGRIDDFWNSVEIYELLGAAEWKRLNPSEKSRRFFLERTK